MSLNYTGSYYTRLSNKSPDAAIQESVLAAIAKAKDLFAPADFEGPWTKGGLGISNITPRSAGATNQASGLQGNVAGSGAWGVTAVTASTWTDWVNLSIDDRVYAVVTGVLNRTPNPHITMIKPFANGQDLPVISTEEMYTFEEQKGYFTQPIIVSPGNVFKVQVWSPVTLAGVPSEQIGLLGYLVGKRAYLIATS